MVQQRPSVKKNGTFGYSIFIFSGMTEPVIFIVDSNVQQGNFLKYHLNAKKFNHVWFFNSVEECLYRLRKQPPDFLITEYHLAGYTGHEFLRMACKISPKTQVLFFSSADDAAVAESLLAAGARDYVVRSGKPEKSIYELIRNIEYLHSELITKQN